MSRPNKAVKKEIWEGRSIFDCARFAHYGDWFEYPDAETAAIRYSKALHFIQKTRGAIRLESGTFETEEWPGVSNDETYQIIAECEKNDAWKLLSEAIKKRNIRLLLDVAHILENEDIPNTPKRAAFANVILQCRVSRIPLPTPKEMLKAFKQNGVRITYTDIRRFQEYFGVTLPKSKKRP